VVVGNGQSAQCSEFLSYPVSQAQQIFLMDAAGSVKDCQRYDSIITWK